MKLPEHIHLRIEHNPHAVNYQSIEQWIAHWIFLEEIAKSKPDEAIVAKFASGAKPEAGEIARFAPLDTIEANDLAEILRTGEVWVIN